MESMKNILLAVLLAAGIAVPAAAQVGNVYIHAPSTIA